MIRKLLRAIPWMVGYASVATVIAQAILLVFIARSWHLDKNRMARALAAAQGIDLPPADPAAALPRREAAREQVSYEEVLDARARKLRDLELREQALANALAQLDHEQRKLTDEQQRIAALKKSFATELATIGQQATSQGIEDTRAKLMAIKPDQAKLLLDDLLDEGEMQTVVTLIRGMPDSKASRIIGEFKSEEDLERIGEVLRRIIDGDAVGELAAVAAGRLEGAAAAEP